VLAICSSSQCGGYTRANAAVPKIISREVEANEVGGPSCTPRLLVLDVETIGTARVGRVMDYHACLPRLRHATPLSSIFVFLTAREPF
jgi:hypothetical protein